MKKRLLFFGGLLIFYLIPLAIVSIQISQGTFPFWYDNARDFLQALSKPTLIGPTTGVPGIFYGPYWIWLMSLALLVSKDPRVVDFLVATLPYFILLPLLLFKLRKVFNSQAVLIVWVLFITSFSAYAMQLWNPYPAPLLFVALVTIITLTDFKKLHKRTLLQIFSAGFVAGLVANFHLSFGIGVLAGSVLFFLLRTVNVNYSLLITHFSFPRGLFRSVVFARNDIAFLFTFLAGIAFAFAPFFLFEFKHGFHQIQTLITVATSKEILVQQTGMSNPEIIGQLVTISGRLFHIEGVLSHTIALTILIAIFLVLKQYRKSLTEQEKQFLLFVSCIFVTLFSIYLTARYPVWNYHFIGTETLLLLFILFILHRSTIMRKIGVAAATILLLIFFYQSLQGTIQMQKNPYAETWLTTQEHIIRWIANDAGETTYDIYAFSPSIHTYEYDYLSQWLLHRPLHTDTHTEKQTVYLIIPKTKSEVYHDFINYKTPPDQYRTTKNYLLPDKTTVVKRERNK